MTKTISCGQHGRKKSVSCRRKGQHAHCQSCKSGKHNNAHDASVTVVDAKDRRGVKEANHVEKILLDIMRNLGRQEAVGGSAQRRYAQYGNDCRRVGAKIH